MYINEVERLDGFGQEIFPVKVAYPGLSLASPFSEQHRHLAQTFGKPVSMAAGQSNIDVLLPHAISWQV